MPDLPPVSSTQESTQDKAAQGLVNTNAALQKALQQLPVRERSEMILRCDDLPLVNGTEATYEKAFCILLQLILGEKKKLPAVFLHIHCTAEEIDSSRPTELKQFSIQFNTNIAATANWLKQHEQEITDAKTLLQQNGAALLVNQLKFTGCIFSISLPGKTL